MHDTPIRGNASRVAGGATRHGMAGGPSACDASIPGPPAGAQANMPGLAHALARVMEDDLSGFLHGLAGDCVVDREALARSGKGRPTLVLHAVMARHRDLAFVVGPGPLGLDGRLADDGHWELGPSGGRMAGSRPSNELVRVRDAHGLFVRHDLKGLGLAVSHADEARVRMASTLSRAAMAAWEHCRQALSRDYDVQVGHALSVVDYKPGGAVPHASFLRIVPLKGATHRSATRETAPVVRQGGTLVVDPVDGRAQLKDAVVSLACDTYRGDGLGSQAEARPVLGRVVDALDSTAPGWDAPMRGDATGSGSVEVAATRVPPGRRQASKAYFGKPGEPTPHLAEDRLYARLRCYDATPGELALVSAASLVEYVERINAGFRAKGRLPLPRDDYPMTRKRFERLVRMYGSARG